MKSFLHKLTKATFIPIEVHDPLSISCSKYYANGIIGIRSFLLCPFSFTILRLSNDFNAQSSQKLHESNSSFTIGS
jgi:hypothetical protein